MFTSLLYNKGYEKDTDEQSDEETHKMGPKNRSFRPHGVGVCHLSNIWMCSPTQKFSKPHFWDFYGGFIV